MTETEHEKGDTMAPGSRVSLEFPEAGTCVARVSSLQDSSVVLELLDPLPDTDVSVGAPLDLFMPRTDGIYYWPCSLSGEPVDRRAEVALLGPPVFVQRRVAPRVEAGALAEVRRSHSTRRGKAHEMRVADVSRGGMKLEGPFHLSTGDTVEVSFEAGARVEIACRTVMAYPLGEGNWAAHLCFLEGQREAVEVVDAYIARRISKVP